MALDGGIPPKPNNNAPAYPNSSIPSNWKDIADGTDDLESPAYPGSAVPENWQAPDNKSEYESEDETPVGKTVPDDFEAPKQERKGLNELGYNFGRGVGDLKNTIDRNYDRIQAEQNARKGSGAGSGASAGATGGAHSPSVGGAGAGSGASAGATGAGAGATDAAGAAKGAGGAAKGMGGKGGANVRGEIDKAKNQLEQAGDQAGGKAGEGIDKALGAVDKVEQVVDKTATGLMVFIYVILAWLVLLSSLVFLFSTGFLGAIVGIFPLISPKYSYKILVWILYFFAVGKAVDNAVDANNVKLNTTEKLIVGINAFLVFAAWVIIFGGILVIMTYSICKTATTGATGFLASGAAIVSDAVAGTNFQSGLEFCGSFTSAIENATGLGGGSPGAYNLAGYNIGAYATDPEHEKRVTAIYESLKDVDFSTAQAITAYMKKKAPSTPLTGEMVLSSATKSNVDAKLVVAMMMQDSTLGTAGKGARTHNPGNVGNDDAGNLIDYGTWEKGVDAVASWLNKHRAK